MAIPREKVEEILQAARIEEVVGEFVPLKKRGSNLIGRMEMMNDLEAEIRKLLADSRE